MFVSSFKNENSHKIFIINSPFCQKVAGTRFCILRLFNNAHFLQKKKRSIIYWLIVLALYLTYAAFTHAGLTTRY